MKLTIMPKGTRVNVLKNTRLIDALKDNNIEISADLCMIGNCGRCKVIVETGNDNALSAKEYQVLSDEEIAQGIRMACSFNITKDTVIWLSEVDSNLNMNDRARIDISADNNTGYGLVVDIGTTNIEVALYRKRTQSVVDGLDNRLSNGNLLNLIAKQSVSNPQRIIGQDVISRIAYCTDETRLAKTANMVRVAINKMIKELVPNNAILENIVICGNTTMLHLFLGKDVASLGQYPFTTGYRGGEFLKVTDYLEVNNKECELIVPPIIKSHVGADALTCLYYINSIKEDSCNSFLMVDIGTNAEIVLYNEGEYYASATAAGPAFEGMGISCGMKLTKGAIKAVRQMKGNIIYEVHQVGSFGGDDPRFVEAKGFCASGILDMISVLRDEGVIDEFGTIDADFEVSAVNRRINITQNDVRSIQLAKSAVMSGIMTLAKQTGISLNLIDSIVLAGAFGNSINIDSAVRIGLLPDVDRGKFILVGNGAMFGCEKLLRDKNMMNEYVELSSRVNHIELGDIEYFKNIYIDNLNMY